MRIYKAGEFSKKIGVSSRTLIRWDQSGKFKAYRTPTNQKYYTHEQYIKYCIQSGMQPDDIEAFDTVSQRKGDN